MAIPIFYVILVLVVGNNLFYMVPSGNVLGSIDYYDLGLLMVFMGVFIEVILHRRDLSALSSFFTWWIFAYLLIICVQASVASYLYAQSIKDGLIAARHQFYYLIFLLMVFALDDHRKIDRFMSQFTWLALLIVFLGLVNYYVITIFHYFRAEGQGIRSGIVRAYIPGMEIIVAACLWQFVRYILAGKLVSPSLFYFLILFGGIVFRQTRSFVLAVTIVVAGFLVYQKRFKLLAAGAVALACMGAVSSMMSSEPSLLVNAVESSYDELSTGGGKWYWRLKQIEDSWKIFVDTMWTGSGGIVIRNEGGGWAGWGDLLLVAYNVDTGYWVWVKFFGIPGILLLGAGIYVFYKQALRLVAVVEGTQLEIVWFCICSFSAILVAMVIEPYFTRSPSIMIVALCWAPLVTVKLEAERARLRRLA